MEKIKKILKEEIKKIKNILKPREIFSMLILLVFLFSNVLVSLPEAGAVSLPSSTNCMIYDVLGTYCGDGIVNGPEQCDLGDQNGVKGSGCSSTCQLDQESDPVATIIAHKIVCEDADYLPQWGPQNHSEQPSQINADTAQDFLDAVNAEGKVCWLEEDWDFEWGYDGDVSKTTGDYIGYAGGNWNQFDLKTGLSGTPANAMVTEMNGFSNIYVREVLKEGYIPFTYYTGEGIGEPPSAELYCHEDIWKYDNYDRIDGVELGETYYCVAFNVPKTCSVVSDTTNIVEDGTNAVETWIHSNWFDQDLLGPAKWIWETFNVLNPTMDETKVFVKNFSLDLPPISATIEVAADNGFILEINGVEIANEIDEEHNYETTKTYPVTNLIVGTNTIRMTVKNFAQSGGIPETNPAGALYKLTVFGSDDCGHVELEDPDPEMGEITVRKEFTGYDDQKMHPEPANFYFSVNDGESQSFGSDGKVVISIPYGPYLITEVDPGANWEVSTSTDCVGVMGPMYSGNNETATHDVPDYELECIITNTWVDDDPGDTPPPTTDETPRRGSSGTTVVPEPEVEGEVLGEAIEAECGMYLFEYIRSGAHNNPDEVKKLQVFLNEHMGANLPVTGFYGDLTREAVNAFQLQYKNEVLKPWVDAGIHCDVNEPTGYVYKTTKRWINLIVCPTLNIPMPDLSGYEKANCLPYPEKGMVLGEEIEWVGEEEAEEDLEEPIEEPEIFFEDEVYPEPEQVEEEKAGPVLPALAALFLGLLFVALVAFFAIKKFKKA